MLRRAARVALLAAPGVAERCALLGRVCLMPPAKSAGPARFALLADGVSLVSGCCCATSDVAVAGGLDCDETSDDSRGASAVAEGCGSRRRNSVSGDATGTCFTSMLSVYT
mmetsp:Transcript_131056/g.195313  ORF Transcript_131056/g.195313 Transcript_131056/m.195313 type:complete len:111 (+) Transcript_131056:643-975(+)